MTDLHDAIGAALDREQALAEEANGVEPEYWGALVNDYLGGDVGTYCAAQGPARTLRRTKADWEVLAMHVPDTFTPELCQWDGRFLPCRDLQLLAARYDVETARL